MEDSVRETEINTGGDGTMRNYDNAWGRFTPEEMPGRIVAGAKTMKDLRHEDGLKQMAPYHSILDFGCGVGRNTFWLAGHGHFVTAFDLPNMIEALKRDPRMPKLSNRIHATTDWRNIRLKTYDAILACQVFQHIPKDVLEEYLDALRVMSGHMFVNSRSYLDNNDGQVFPVLEKYFEIDESLTPAVWVNGARHCTGEESFQIWMKPKQ